MVPSPDSSKTALYKSCQPRHVLHLQNLSAEAVLASSSGLIFRFSLTAFDCQSAMYASNYSLYSGPSMQALLTGAKQVNGDPKVAIIGHRGSGKNMVEGPRSVSDPRPSIMENTIVSFNVAAQDGADFVEFDVQVTQDGHPIIFHDDFIVVNDKKNDSVSSKKIGEMTLEEFMQIGFQKRSQKSDKELLRKTPEGTFSSWEVTVGDSFCTLREAFAQVSPSVGFNIELKFEDDAPTSHSELKRSINAVLKVVYENGQGRKVFFSSFHPDAILLLRHEQTLYPALFLTHGVPGKFLDHRRNSLVDAIEVCLQGNLQGIVSEVDAVLAHPETVQQIKAANLTLLTYGDLNNVADTLHIQERLGVDGLVVDHVSKMVTESMRNKVKLLGNAARS